jgi:hypothetical protein
MLPTAEEISQAQSKERPLPIEPWVAANLSRLWQTMKKQIQDTIVADTQVQHQTAQSEPASVRSHS